MAASTILYNYIVLYYIIIYYIIRYLELDTGQENVRGVATHFAQRIYTPLWLHKVVVDNKAVHKKLMNCGIGEAHRHP